MPCFFFLRRYKSWEFCLFICLFVRFSISLIVLGFFASTSFLLYFFLFFFLFSSKFHFFISQIHTRTFCFLSLQILFQLIRSKSVGRTLLQKEWKCLLVFKTSHQATTELCALSIHTHAHFFSSLNILLSYWHFNYEELLLLFSDLHTQLKHHTHFVARSFSRFTNFAHSIWTDFVCLFVFWRPCRH